MRWLLVLLLTGCASHYQWEHKYPASETVEWVMVPDVKQRCGWKQERGYVTVAACAVQIFESKTCYVFSAYSELQARSVHDLDGMSIYEHEMRHCQGWRH